MIPDTFYKVFDTETGLHLTSYVDDCDAWTERGTLYTSDRDAEIVLELRGLRQVGGTTFDIPMSRFTVVEYKLNNVDSWPMDSRRTTCRT